MPSIPPNEPTRRERLECETELFGFAVSGHPLELFEDVAWDTYCPVKRLGEFIGQIVTACGLLVEQRTHHQDYRRGDEILTMADWTGMVETELFAQTYKTTGWRPSVTRCWRSKDGSSRSRMGKGFFESNAGGEAAWATTAARKHLVLR